MASSKDMTKKGGGERALIAAMLAAGAVGVMPTDTIYGIVGSALEEKTVERIYRLRRRNRKKPMIVLIAGMHDLRRFGIVPSPRAARVLRRVWPGKVSVVLACPPRRFAYLHRGTGTIAFRVPASAPLRAFLARTGPLVAPSANIEGEDPARTVAEAKRYFGDRVEFYAAAGRAAAKPSTLIAVAKNGAVTMLRKGAGGAVL